MNILKVCKNIEEVYPDIDGELCSKHSTHLSRVKQVFCSLYQQDPQFCVVSQGVCTIFKAKAIELSMALESGITIYFAKTFNSDKIYLNCNRRAQEIIFDHQGRIAEGKSDLADKLSAVHKIAIQDLSLTKVQGAIIYIHSNLPSNAFQQQAAILEGYLITILQVNTILQAYTSEEIYEKMVSIPNIGQDRQIYNKLLRFQNRLMNLQIGESEFQIPLEGENKFIFVKLTCSEADQKYADDRRKQIAEQETEFFSFFSQFGLYSWEAILEKIGETQVPESLALFAQRAQGTLELTNRMGRKQIEFFEFLSQIWGLNSHLYSPSLLNKIEEIALQFKLESFTVVHDEFLMIGTSKQLYIDLIRRLKGYFGSGNLSEQKKDVLESGKWGTHRESGMSSIFSSVPSRGLSIFDPSGSLWFDD